jgi:uncharacterized protein (DUF1697 family)
MSQYVALLRGINVGGNNMIPMAALRTCFEAQGLEGVVTYIQSGNVLFSAGEPASAKLARRIEAALASTFNYKASLVLRTRKQMQEIVGGAPAGFGAQPDKYRYDVVFLMSPVTAAAAIKIVPTREGVDRAYAGSGVLYFARLAAKATQSRLPKVASMPIYQSMTIRNWRTTTTLLQMMQATGA